MTDEQIIGLAKQAGHGKRSRNAEGAHAMDEVKVSRELLRQVLDALCAAMEFDVGDAESEVFYAAAELRNALEQPAFATPVPKVHGTAVEPVPPSEMIEHLLSALEYHEEQTRPIHSTTTAIQAAREYLRSMK